MIPLWHKVRTASPADRALAVEALIVLVAARLALWCFPFVLARRLLNRYPRLAPARSVPAERIAWAVAAAARRLPAPFRHCLAQALAAEARAPR